MPQRLREQTATITGFNYRYRCRMPVWEPTLPPYHPRSTKADINSFSRIQREFHRVQSLGLWWISASDEQGSVAGIVFFVALLWGVWFILLAKYPRSSPAHTRHHPVGNCTNTRVLGIDQVPGTPHQTYQIYFKAPLGWSHWFTFPADTQPLLRVGIGSFAIASCLIFLFYFLALISPCLSTILLLSDIIDDYCFIYCAELNTVQIAAGVDSS